jgi:hypothetical protein
MTRCKTRKCGGAFEFAESAFFRSGGTGNSFAGWRARIGLDLGESRCSTAARMHARITESFGRSASDVSFPNWPMPAPAVFVFGSHWLTSMSRQKNSEQCALNAASPQSTPWYSKNGEPHLIVSTAAGHPWWISFRRCFRIGRANSAASSIYESTRGSFVVMGLGLVERSSDTMGCEREAPEYSARAEQILGIRELNASRRRSAAYVLGAPSHRVPPMLSSFGLQCSIRLSSRALAGLL